MKLNTKVSDRSNMLIVMNQSTFNLMNEKTIVEEFNQIIKNIREETHSLVLSSFREYSRKRLTFE